MKTPSPDNHFAKNKAKKDKISSPNEHLALLGLVPYGTLLALSVLELQCELVKGTGNNLHWRV